MSAARVLVAATTFSLAVIFAAVEPVSAGEEGCSGSFTPSFICVDAIERERTGTPQPIQQASAVPTIVFIREEIPSFQCFGPPEGPFIYGVDAQAAAPSPADLGVLVQVVPRGPNGEFLPGATTSCSLAAPDTLIPPPAPSADEIRAAVVELLPQPTVELNPRARGIVGFEVWLWSEVTATPVAASVEVRGWTATVTATPTAWHWRSSTGLDTDAFTPGSEARPAATFAWPRAGTHSLTHAVTWTGTYDVAGYGTALPAQDLGTVEPEATIDQDVAEVEAVVRD